MFRIDYYKDINGKQPVKDFIDRLNGKDEQLLVKKIIHYMAVLQIYGTRAGEPYVKHIEGDIWELRPSRTRIFFFHWKEGQLVMLHYLECKKTQKTPKGAIDQAKRNQEDFLSRLEKKK